MGTQTLCKVKYPENFGINKDCTVGYPKLLLSGYL